MRIRDWSSDVCSSDLQAPDGRAARDRDEASDRAADRRARLALLYAEGLRKGRCHHAGARALQRRAELPADSLEEFCAERLVELATDRRADLVIDLGARRQSRTTLRSSSDSARRGHDDLIVGRDRDLRDLLVSTAAEEIGRAHV